MSNSLCNPTDYSPLGSSVHGILQVTILEWVAIPFSRGSSWPRNWTQVSCTAGRLFTIWATRDFLKMPYKSANPLLGVYPKRLKTQIPKSTCNPVFRAAWLTIAKMWKRLKCPSTNDWIKKMCYVYTPSTEHWMVHLHQCWVLLLAALHWKTDCPCCQKNYSLTVLL